MMFIGAQATIDCVEVRRGDVGGGLGVEMATLVVEEADVQAWWALQ